MSCKPIDEELINKMKKELRKMVVLGRKVYRTYFHRHKVVAELPRLDVFWDERQKYPDSRLTNHLAKKCGLPMVKKLEDGSKRQIEREVEQWLNETDWFDSDQMSWHLDIDAPSERIKVVIII